MKTLIKEALITIKNSYKRFISILLIVLLGVGFFAGIKATSPDMKATINKYYQKTNFQDLSVISTWGLTQADIKILKENDFEVEGTYSFDTIIKNEEEKVVKVVSYNQDKQINKLILLKGSLPKNNDECVIDSNNETNLSLGEQIIVLDDNLKEKQLTIVGIVKSPNYISLERGSTSLSNGKISSFIYVVETNFQMDYYTEAVIKLANVDSFSSDYTDLLNKAKNNLKKVSQVIQEKRYQEEKSKALKEYEKNYQEYEKKFNQFEAKIKKAKKQIKQAKKDYESNLTKFAETKKNYNQSYQAKFEEITVNYTALNTNIVNLETQLNTLEALEQSLKENISNLNDQIVLTSDPALIAQRDELSLELTDITGQIGILEINLTMLQTNEVKLNQAKKSLMMTNDSYQIELAINEEKLNTANQLLKQQEKDLISQEAKGKKEFAAAREKLALAYQEIENLKKPEFYFFDRENNIGFYQFKQDTERIAKVGILFPLVFFVVALLVCLTAMTRMVEEERTKLGTLKSLGYTNSQILFKYIFYALLATLGGSIIGLLIGFKVLPTVIFNMYRMMYNIGQVELNFNWQYALIGTISALFCTLSATIHVCFKSLKEQPAQLLRPKNIKSGKRIFLEKINFIWRRLSFTRKVTIRNVFRYKKRMIMTIIGVSGCTGLIIAGYGLKDCIMGMVDNQYQKVFNYQVEVTLKEDTTSDEIMTKLEGVSPIKKALKIHKEAVTLDNIKTNQTIQLVVPFGNLDGYINLANRKTKEKYQLNDKIIVSEKLANLLNLKLNDTLKINGEEKYAVKIGHLTENYLGHYLYLNAEVSQGSSYNTILLKTTKMTEKQEKELAEQINQIEGISSLTFTSKLKNTFNSTMENFEYVVLVLIISANLLAFVVLYNLASINISERLRELATIKVLGFYDKEVFNYIGREITILTIISLGLGCVIGKILTIFIIKTCELDMIMFNPVIKVTSYLNGILLTIFFTLIVNITTYLALKKIKMVESLKSVE